MEKFQRIIAKLQEMAELDQNMRNRCAKNPSAWDITIDYQNTERLKTIINEIGWPSISKVGHAGYYNAWLIAQHADHEPDFQKKCLALIKLEPAGEVDKRDIAYLEDRIAIAEGKPQIYGTQFYTNTDGQLIPLPIEDPKNVDERRKIMGLETLNKNQ